MITNPYIRKWVAKYPERREAHKHVAWMLKNGELVRPNVCERCKEEVYTVGHHADYSKPDEVEWLCDKCHTRHDVAERKLAKKIIHAAIKTIIILAFVGMSAFAQPVRSELPEAPLFSSSEISGWMKPTSVKKSPIVTVDRTLIAMDGAWRMLDTYTTYKALNHPCHCMHETDPLSPGSGKLVPTMAFQAGMWATIAVGHQLLIRSHHPRIAHALLVLDNGSEGYAVVQNFRHIGQADALLAKEAR